MRNSGNFWTHIEELKLKKLFIDYSMEIWEISLIHERTPRAIESRLIKLGLLKLVRSEKQSTLDSIDEEEELTNKMDT
jgi:hypothetical protein